MIAYVARRLLSVIPVLLGVSVLVFSVMQLIPGDPAEMVAGENASEEDIANIRRQLGLDRPVHEQYFSFIGNAIKLDFGTSTRSKRPVIDELKQRLPATAELAVASMAFAAVTGLSIGIFAATRPNSIWDNLVMLLAISGVSMPTFWMGIMLILLFPVTLGVLPTSGRGGLDHLVLPALTLGSTSAAIIARQTRSAMLEVMGLDYIRTARAKGLAEGVVIWRHALRNAMITTITILGLQFGFLLGGAAITETVFAWPGVGRLVVDAIKFRDFPVVQATVLVLATMFVIVNLIVDMLYVALDPRIEVG